MTLIGLFQNAAFWGAGRVTKDLQFKFFFNAEL